jgi:hypothetical protein
VAYYKKELEMNKKSPVLKMIPVIGSVVTVY